MNMSRGENWHMVEGSKVVEEPVGKTWQCPRCGYPLEKVAESQTRELWECDRCGYDKMIGGDK